MNSTSVRQSVWEARKGEKNESRPRLGLGVYTGQGSRVRAPTAMLGSV